jgi:hypothetical protein
MRACGKCGETKSIALFGKNKRYADGIWPYCKPCDAARVAQYRAANPEKIKETQAKSRAKNPEKIAETKKKYREANPEKVRLARKLSYAKNKDIELAKASQYKAANKKVLAENAARWLKDNPYLNRFYRSERRAAEKQAKPKWHSRSEIREFYKQAVEFTELTGYPWHVDHIVPLKSDLVCGLHWHGNMQVISGSDNQSKSNRYWPDMPTET